MTNISNFYSKIAHNIGQTSSYADLLGNCTKELTANKAADCRRLLISKMELRLLPH